MKLAELKKKTAAELSMTLEQLCRERFAQTMEKAKLRVTGQSGKTHLIKQTRRNIARVKTLQAMQINVQREGS